MLYNGERKEDFLDDQWVYVLEKETEMLSTLQNKSERFFFVRTFYEFNVYYNGTKE